MDNADFSFTTACSNTAVVCTIGQANCYNLTAVASYTCGLQTMLPSDLTTRLVLFELKSPIVASLGFRVLTNVLNPYYYTSTQGGVYVRAYSRAAKIWYEEAQVTAKFTVQQITVSDKLVTYFWGLTGLAYNTLVRCPIGIYVSPRDTTPRFAYSTNPDQFTRNIANTYLVNKVRIYFQVTSQDFPLGYNWQMTATVNCDTNTRMVYVESSYSTNLPIVTGKRLICKADTAAMTISCNNIGDVKMSTSYWFGINFILRADAMHANNFGMITFKID